MAKHLRNVLWQLRRRWRDPDGDFVTGTAKNVPPAYGEIALDGKHLRVWNGDEWLDIHDIFARLTELERKVDAIEKRN